ncbi:MAG TPA: putative peptidoglycan glycosyltransferase FtsW [Anaerolineae bacterium]|nr:putative peptidoglycan glycosyltransferase FtsW [Anaerolineae bacterium]
MAQFAQVRSNQIKSKEQRWGFAGLPRLDYMLLGAVGTLTLLGLMLVYSGSYDLAYITQDGNSAYYLMRQVVFLGIGVVAMLLLSRSDYMSWRRWSVLLMGGALILLVIVLVFGSERYGAQRTLLQGSVQPSEIIKLITVLYIADWLASKGDRLHDWGYGLVPFAVIIGSITGMILLQPDFGTAITIVLTAGAMLFMAGIDWKQMLLALIVAIAAIIIMMLIFPHTRDRLDQYVQGLQDPTKASEQMQQVWLAMRMGGVFGVGLGNGLIKVGYLPLAHTDSVFAVAAIELGLLGVIAIIALYSIIGWRGYRVALTTGNHYGQLLAFGATTLIVIQAVINIAVMAGVMPLTGIPLPLLSYGGSSLVAMLASVGVIQSVYRGTRKGSVFGGYLGRSRRNRRARLSGAGDR